MRLAQLEVTGLFDQYRHLVRFPDQPQGEPRPSIVIIFGPNGIGKTTLLRMLRGLLRLDFNVFRRLPFAKCNLMFSDGASIEVEPVAKKTGPRPLSVRYRDHHVTLDPNRPGALNESDN